MANEHGKRGNIAPQSNGTEATQDERAAYDDEWRNRPMWLAAMRPDCEWAPLLTTEGRAELEANRVTHDHS